MLASLDSGFYILKDKAQLSVGLCSFIEVSFLRLVIPYL